MKNKCIKEVKPAVDETAIECCGITPSACVLLSEAIPYLQLMKGEELQQALITLSNSIKLLNQKVLLTKDLEGNISQTGTESPIFDVKILDNYPLTLQYVSVGNYTITGPANSFSLSKTVIEFTSRLPLNYIVDSEVISTNQIRIRTYNTSGVLTDGVLSKNYIKIKTPYNV